MSWIVRIVVLIVGRLPELVSLMIVFRLRCFLLISLALSCAATSALADPANEIERLVADLGSGEFEARERAMKEIGRFGDEAIIPLEKAARSTDAEVRYRAAILLEEIRLGISRDLPEEIRNLMLQYRQENVNKQDVMRRMCELGAWKQTQTLLHGEKSEAVRNMLRAVVTQLGSARLTKLAAEGESDEIRTILETTSWNNNDRARLVLYLYATGELPRVIARERVRLESRYPPLADRTAALEALIKAERKPEDHDAALLIAALKAQGDTQEAEAWAIRSGQSFWVEQLALERGDWKLAAAFRKKTLAAQPRDPRALGPSVVLMYLAEDVAERDRLARVMQDAVPKALAVAPPPFRVPELPPGAPAVPVKPVVQPLSVAFPAMKTHFLADLTDEAFAIANTHVPNQAAELRLYRHEFEKGLEAISLSDPGEVTLERFTATLPAGREMNLGVSDFFNRVPIALYAFDQTGRNANYRELIAVAHKKLDLLAMPEPQATFHRTRVSDWEIGIGTGNIRVTEAEAANALADRYVTGQNLPLSFFRDLTPIATFWWNHTASENLPSKAARLAWVRRMLSKNPERLSPPEDWREHIAKVLASAAEKPEDSANAFNAAAETSNIRGDRETALKVRMEQAEKTANPYMHLFAGDLYGKLDDWKNAAVQYEKATAIDGLKPSAGYLQAIALELSGDAEAAAKAKRKALSAALLHPPQLASIASFLSLHGQPEEAAKLYRLQLALFTPDQSFPSAPVQFLGNEASKKNDPSALVRWEQLMYAIADPNVSVAEAKAYLDLPVLRCRSACRAAIAAGDFASAERWFTEAARLAPAHVSTHEKLIPLFDQAGKKEIADRFFLAAITRLRELLAKYPDSDALRNNIAWMSAQCHRDLPEALKLADEAVARSPHRHMYRDTRAEILFRLGRREEAIAEEKKCLAVEPENVFYAKQLARFESGDLSPVSDNEP